MKFPNTPRFAFNVPFSKEINVSYFIVAKTIDFSLISNFRSKGILLPVGPNDIMLIYFNVGSLRFLYRMFKS